MSTPDERIFDWAEVLPNGMIDHLVNETGLLTPSEARAKAADLIAAAKEADRRLGVHMASADCWCSPTVEHVPASDERAAIDDLARAYEAQGMELMRQVISDEPDQPDDAPVELAERIAAVQLAHMGDPYQQDMGESPCGFKYSTLEELAAHIADAVIRELGLREEWLVDDIEPYDTREQAAERKAELIGDYGDDPPAEGVPVRFRYVTDWKADDLLPPCKQTADARAWADLALMRLRVTAWARDCVTHGDLTPAGERALLRILGGNSE